MCAGGWMGVPRVECLLGIDGTVKGGHKKTSFLKNFMCNFLVNRWCQEGVLLRT